MTDKLLPIYQIQDFHASRQKEHYFYLSTLSAHLKEHLFIQKAHKHNFYILLFITRGSGTHTIDFIEYPIEPNAVFFMAPGQVHSWELSDDTEGFIIFFTPEFFLLEYPQKKLQHYPFFKGLFPKPLLELSEVDQAVVSTLLHQLQQEYEQQMLLKEDMLRNYLDILLISLARMYEPDTEVNHAPAAAPLPQVQLLEELIDKHYKEHRPVSFYADQLHLSARQLNEVSKRSTGKTTTELMQNRLILEAQRLLVHSGLTVSQVAAELGFFDNAYFFRFFKKHVGQTPEQFRMAHS